MTRAFIYKAWLGSAGLVTGLFGIALTRRWMVWAAVAMLAVAFTLRFTERKVDSP
jgi:membrane protein implicated in regulation of membrane protease activity